jgi:HlyD family secretion protein
MFPVLVRIDNRGGLLRPGLNAEVEVHVGEGRDVLAVPNAALRTPRDVASAAGVLGLAPDQVQRELARQAQGGGGTGPDTGRGGERDGGAAGQGANGQASLGGAARDTAASGGRVVRRVAVAAPAAGGLFGGRYIVFVKRPGGPEPVWIRTGLTDLDYSEVREGLQAGDSVLVLPSASLVQSQQESQERANRITGGGGLPGMRQQGATGTEGGTRIEVQRTVPAPGNR